MSNNNGYFEFAYDQLLKEVEDIDQVLRDVGFVNGWASLKKAALAIKDEMNNEIAE
ncbi:hypothetical protein CLAVI_000272 [Candidatus Clavichlamydia salmonicola]|uniref:hypothetical protein n=1 Tax=Candidatus Clavichlamydia salmonicola TaxID=469812 RepID=UPI001891D94C|nr:hypothetical protein [Candidatus Clavichlamydia salmonicola]MBF5050658.1 hypothetical protein [Candidatus Clavichlamydia salmonicola]